MRELTVRAAAPGDESGWKELFAGYRAFYRLPDDPSVGDRVWGWIVDPGHEVDALVAERDGGIVALADYRPFSRPSRGDSGLYLDDLFTDPDHRGRGAARALVEALGARGAEQGRALLRWNTAADNATARALYDRLATATDWVVYDRVLP